MKCTAVAAARVIATVWAAWALASLPTAAAASTTTTETSLASFEGEEEPTVLYHPSTGSFTNDTYDNITDQGGGIVRFTLRYQPDQDWWDGDRNTTNTDRQRAEVKGLGPHQANNTTFEYSFDWRTDPTFFGGSGFLHIFQLKALNGDNSPPLVTLDPGKGTGSGGSVRIWSGTAANSSTIRSFTYTRGVWQHADIKITVATGNTGSILASINGDAFSGVHNVPVFRADATSYRPKWGFYRGIASDLTVGEDWVEDKNVAVTQIVPEPATAALFAGAAMLLLRRRRRRALP